MIALLLAFSLFAIDPSAGTAGFDFLSVPLVGTTRSASMAGAATASASGAMAFWYNPAHTICAGPSGVELGYMNYLAGIHIGELAYSKRFTDHHAVGVGAVYLNSGTMKRTDRLGTELGTFGVSYVDLNVSTGLRLLDALSLGIGLQGLYGSIDTFFTLGLATNIGASAEIPLQDVKGLSAGVAARNVGYQLRPFQTQRDPMPAEVAFGIAYQPNRSLSLNFDLRKPLANRLNVRAGIEGWVSDLLVLRCGYSTLGSDLKSGGGSDILAGITTGLGIRHRNYQLDYCFVPMVELGMAHRISLSVSL